MKKKLNIGRYKPNYQNGLTNDQVISRTKDKLINRTKVAVGKSISEIIFGNLFSFFNCLLYVVAGFLIFAKAYTSLFFLAVLIPNILIGLIQDLQARHLMRKLRLMTAPKARAIRDGKEVEIQSDKVVLDDVILLKSGDQVCADGIILNGSVAVNESLLTGESENVYKINGDKVFAGSYIASGRAYVQMVAVGEDTYISSLQNQANKFKRSPSQILKSLKRMFVFIGSTVVILGCALVATYFYRNKFTPELINSSITEIAGSMVSMIPSGLFLLTSVALATGVISLAKKKTAVQELYSIEMLARVDVLCLDKTGTITDGSMKVQQVIPLESIHTPDQLKQIISNVINATNDENDTAKSLKEYFNFGQTSEAINILPFNSENKYSGATLRGKGTYIIGAFDYLSLKNKKGVEYKIQEYTTRGYRVLVVGHANEAIQGNKFNALLTPIALIVLKDNIRKEALDTFKWFADNNVDIKVISGDDPITVSEVAKEAGIKNADKYISLAGKTLDEVKLLANEYTVFGRVTPEQKEVLVISLKEKGHCVAMTGDGVNDILALKRADCSIAMANGSAAARNVSHIVLLDSNFSRLTSVVAEGRRVINNIQRTSSLFLVKTTFAVLLTIFFTIMSLIDKNYSYPFLTNHMYIWEILAIGLPAFMLALQPNKEPIKGNFLKNIFKKAIPAGIAAVSIVLINLVVYFIDKQDLFYLGYSSNENAYSLFTSMSVIGFAIFSFVVLYRICSPINFKTNKYRSLVFIGFALAGISILGIDALLTLVFNFDSIFKICWGDMTIINLFVSLFITVIVSSVYLLVLYVIDSTKEAN